jgi:hypothetical protein
MVRSLARQSGPQSATMAYLLNQISLEGCQDSVPTWEEFLLKCISLRNHSGYERVLNGYQSTLREQRYARDARESSHRSRFSEQTTLAVSSAASGF